MTDNKLNDFVNELLATDGIETVDLEIKINVTHRQVHTGEVDDVFNPIRERKVTEEQFEKLATKYGVHYSGTIDVRGDYLLIDKFTERRTVEPDDGV